VTVGNLSDAEFAQRVRQDAIDILVDLSGHTAGNRLLAFARRAAPIQVTWLGYLNTTGLSEMDFRITDAWADPVGVTERWHTEELVRLPRSLWCYSPWPDSPPVAMAPCVKSGLVTFGSTNNPVKLNLTVLQAWATILARLPDSRMQIYAPDDHGLRDQLATILCSKGAARQRIQFFPRLPIGEYLERYAAIDIALDTFPCAGGTTTFDAIWMGVPVVSLAGERPFSRGGASILGNLGLTECLASSVDDYIERAVSLAGDMAGLTKRRTQLRGLLDSSVLTDGGAFARSLEEALLVQCRARGLIPNEAP
jgi:predicted O-linked N-acetylglucosamine transferase (SPINDLY family)